jgi:hypothetical protein
MLANNKASACPALQAHHRKSARRPPAPSSLPQKSTNLHFHARRPAFHGSPSADKLKGTSMRVSKALARKRVPLRSQLRKGHTSLSRPEFFIFSWGRISKGMCPLKKRWDSTDTISTPLLRVCVVLPLTFRLHYA